VLYSYELFAGDISPCYIAASCVYHARKVMKLKEPWNFELQEIT